MKVVSTECKPIKMWLDDLEEGAMKQAWNLAMLPFTFKHVAIMPDAHQGYGMPIGGVLATDGVVIPNAVGVDIGCGMCAIKTTLRGDCDPEKLKKVLDLIRRKVPTGYKKHVTDKHRKHMPPALSFQRLLIVTREFSKATQSLGTLGGGNHFIELQTDGDNLWVMIHSGSRNLGKQVADHYNKEAKRLNKFWHTKVQESFDLAFLPLDSLDGVAYWNEMNYCVDFALANRKVMMQEVLETLDEVFGTFPYEPMINIAHNYATQENHFGKNVVVHRKGATLARNGTIGIIPGSQGTSSYIVEGLGNPESFNSCSHGAGRKMGRKAAQRDLSLEREQQSLDKMGIIHSVRRQKDLDEAPGAYKDIDQVMANQSDLVKIVTQLRPLAVVKG